MQGEFRKEVLDPGWHWDDSFGFTQAVRLGPWVMVSGQVGMDGDGNVVGPDMESQARQTFRNMAQVLDMAGGGLEDVVQIRAYVTDFSEYAAYDAVRSEMLGPRPFASSTIGVSRLYYEELVIEIDATAYIGSGA